MNKHELMKVRWNNHGCDNSLIPFYEVSIIYITCASFWTLFRSIQPIQLCMECLYILCKFLVTYINEGKYLNTFLFEKQNKTNWKINKWSINYNENCLYFFVKRKVIELFVSLLKLSYQWLKWHLNLHMNYETKL